MIDKTILIFFLPCKILLLFEYELENMIPNLCRRSRHLETVVSEWVGEILHRRDETQKKSGSTVFLRVLGPT